MVIKLALCNLRLFCHKKSIHYIINTLYLQFFRSYIYLQLHYPRKKKKSLPSQLEIPGVSSLKRFSFLAYSSYYNIIFFSTSPFDNSVLHGLSTASAPGRISCIRQQIHKGLRQSGFGYLQRCRLHMQCGNAVPVFDRSLLQ